MIVTRLTTRSSQKGFSLLELAIVLVVVSIMVIGLVQWQIAAAKTGVYATVARQTRAVAEAGLRYTTANNASLLLTTGPTTPVTVSVATLEAGAYLQANTALNNSYGQTYELVITQDASGNLLPIVSSIGGLAMSDGDVRSIATAITQDGGAGGFIANVNADTPGPTFAVGNSGMKVLLSNYGLAPGAGHVIDAVFFEQQAAQTNVDTSLHRVADANSPADNTMSTSLNMGTNTITNAGNISSNNSIGTSGLSATSGYPATWAGGVHTFDLYAEDNIGVGTGGALALQLSTSGDIYSNGGWYRSTGSTGWYSTTYGGGIYMIDANWLRVYNNKGIYTAGQIQGGTMVSNGRLDAQEFAEIDGTATIGNSCSPNGLLAQAVGGSGMVQCKAGVWSLLAGLRSTVQVVSGQICGTPGGNMVASCPAGYMITGGGFQLTAYSPVGSNAVPAPYNSIPSGNGWLISTSSVSGNSCFVAYAICGQ